MKHIVRYLLEGNGSVPLFIEDGGYFLHEEELVGLSIDDSLRQLPATVYKLTEADLKDRLLLMGVKDEEGTLLSEAQCLALAEDFFAQKGL